MARRAPVTVHGVMHVDGVGLEAWASAFPAVGAGGPTLALGGEGTAWIYLGDVRRVGCKLTLGARGAHTLLGALAPPPTTAALGLRLERW